MNMHADDINTGNPLHAEQADKDLQFAKFKSERVLSNLWHDTYNQAIQLGLYTPANIANQPLIEYFSSEMEAMDQIDPEPGTMLRYLYAQAINRLAPICHEHLIEQ